MAEHGYCARGSAPRKITAGSQCFAINCTQYQNPVTKSSGITFHKFPNKERDPEGHAGWERNCRRKSAPSCRALVCSEHFKEDCFDRTGQTVRLRAGAIPTLFQLPKHLQTMEEEDSELITCWPPLTPPVSSPTSGSTPEVHHCSSTVDTFKDFHGQTGSDRDSMTSGIISSQENIDSIGLRPAKRQCPTYVGWKVCSKENSPHPVSKMSKDSDRSCRGAEQLASVALAHWWRTLATSTQTALQLRSRLPKSHNPHTLLAAVQRMQMLCAFLSKGCDRLDTAQGFFASKVRHLQNKLAVNGPTANLHAALGTLYEKMYNLPKAYDHLDKAVELDPTERQYSWHLQQVLRQIQVHTAQTTARHLIVSAGITGAMRNPIPVERCSAESLSYPEFLTRFALTCTPVVITGLVDLMTKRRWTIDHIKDMAGECQVTTRRLVEGSAEWAHLEDGPTMTVSDFIRRTQNQEELTEERQELLYLFDWSLPQHCPKLAQQLSIPKYFSGDFLQQTTPGSLYRESWPSLFVAPAGLRSELHVDAFGSNFWMALMSGSKRWVFFSQEDAPYLYPRYQDSFDPVFDLDLGDPDLQKYPLAQLAQPMEVILQEGEVLFVPSGCPHRVENLTSSVAISANYVDLSNISVVRRELSIQALVDCRAEDLLRQLNAPDFGAKTKLSSAHLPWTQFKCEHNKRTAEDAGQLQTNEQE